VMIIVVKKINNKTHKILVQFSNIFTVNNEDMYDKNIELHQCIEFVPNHEFHITLSRNFFKNPLFSQLCCG
jgi:hypothetical protein